MNCHPSNYWTHRALFGPPHRPTIGHIEPQPVQPLDMTCPTIGHTPAANQ